ncbi:MAG: PUR family DNA/RNA-binding protein [Bacteroidales bacterium]|jgi:hypothetical protein|nr:PUR family DNA/RNA-binding protein [Bacteroidales bacterium]
MENNERREREEVFSTAVKAGKRTYFFDVKETLSGERFITITESKRRFNDEDGSFSYEKHKIFLYKEDNEKFVRALADTIKYIETGIEPERHDDTTDDSKDDSLDDFDFSIEQ